MTYRKLRSSTFVEKKWTVDDPHVDPVQKIEITKVFLNSPRKCQSIIKLVNQSIEILFFSCTLRNLYNSSDKYTSRFFFDGFYGEKNLNFNSDTNLPNNDFVRDIKCFSYRMENELCKWVNFGPKQCFGAVGVGLSFARISRTLLKLELLTEISGNWATDSRWCRWDKEAKGLPALRALS